MQKYGNQIKESMYNTIENNVEQTTVFEDFIIKCCAMDEWDLRDFLKEELKANGFHIQEDDYTSRRQGKFKTIRNMLATRGDAKVCMVAHTDVCRDHDGGPFIKPNPVVKLTQYVNGTRRIIQDLNCDVQTGGDDRLGVAIGTWIALNTGYDLGLLFTTDEEIGNQSASRCKFPELLDFEILTQIDRGNHRNQLVVNIGGLPLCSKETGTKLLELSRQIGLPRVPVHGMMTDVLALRRNQMCKNAVNMTCGYHNSYGSSPDEYIDVLEAEECRTFVNEIIKSYEMDQINEIEKNTAHILVAEESPLTELERVKTEWN